jgi:hypothetical protein
MTDRRTRVPGYLMLVTIIFQLQNWVLERWDTAQWYPAAQPRGGRDCLPAHGERTHRDGKQGGRHRLKGTFFILIFARGTTPTI